MADNCDQVLLLVQLIIELVMVETDADGRSGEDRESREVEHQELLHLTGFQRDLLTSIAAEEQRSSEVYGLAIKRAIESDYEQDVNHGRLYPNLDELVKKEYVKKSELDKRTNEYILTDKAYEQLESYIETISQDVRV